MAEKYVSGCTYIQKYRHAIMLAILLLAGGLCSGCGSVEREAMAESVVGAEDAGVETVDAPATGAESAGTDTVDAPATGAESAGTETVDALTAGAEDAVPESLSGNDAAEPPVPDITRPDPVKVKGIYVSGPVAGIAKMDDLIALVDETELNAMVIDIKNDEGRVTYKMQSEQVLEIDAGVGYIVDIEKLVAKCKEKNIYLIARIVAFKDPYLAEKKPEWAVHTKDGEIFRDKNGMAWVNPYRREVWDYLEEIAAQAAQEGFDEVQFDYIRFSTDIREEEVDYGAESADASKVDIITEFTGYLYEKLAPQGVYVAADVFGTVIDNETDQAIVGQDYVRMAAHLDYICPMVYPSHYHNGSYGIPVPDAEPYQTIYAAAASSVQELKAVPEENRAHVRMWLQSFTAGWVPGHISYGPDQIRAQIKGAYNAGYDEWILWNAAVNYQPESLLTGEEAEAERMRWEEEKQGAAEAESKTATQPQRAGDEDSKTQSAEETQEPLQAAGGNE